jgi:hypothetical protein
MPLYNNFLNFQKILLLYICYIKYCSSFVTRCVVVAKNSAIGSDIPSTDNAPDMCVDHRHDSGGSKKRLKTKIVKNIALRRQRDKETKL